MAEKVTETRENWDFGRSITKHQAQKEADAWIGTVSEHGTCFAIEVLPLPFGDRAIIAQTWVVIRHWRKREPEQVWAVFVDTPDEGNQLAGLRWDKGDAERLYRQIIRQQFQSVSISDDGQLVFTDLPNLDRQFPWVDCELDAIKSSAEIMSMSLENLDKIKSAFFEEEGPWIYMQEVTVL